MDLKRSADLREPNNNKHELLHRYLGDENFSRLTELSKQVNPEQAYDTPEVQQLWRFVMDQLKKIDNQQSATVRGELRSYFNDLGLYNLPRFR